MTHPRVCAQCNVAKPPRSFSSNQWSKGLGLSRCSACVASSTKNGKNPSKKSSSPFCGPQPPNAGDSLFGSSKPAFIFGGGTAAPVFGGHNTNSHTNNNPFGPSQAAPVFGSGTATPVFGELNSNNPFTGNKTPPEQKLQTPFGPQQTQKPFAPAPASVFGGNTASTAMPQKPQTTNTPLFLNSTSTETKTSPFLFPSSQPNQPNTQTTNQNSDWKGLFSNTNPVTTTSNVSGPWLGSTPSHQPRAPNQNTGAKNNNPLGARQGTGGFFFPAPAPNTSNWATSNASTPAPGGGVFTQKPSSSSNIFTTPNTTKTQFSCFPSQNPSTATTFGPAKKTSAPQHTWLSPANSTPTHNQTSAPLWLRTTTATTNNTPNTRSNTTGAVPGFTFTPQNTSTVSGAQAASGFTFGPKNTSTVSGTTPAKEVAVERKEPEKQSNPAPETDLSRPIGAPPHDSVVVLPSFDEYNRVGINALLDSMRELEQEDISVDSSGFGADYAARPTPSKTIRPRGFSISPQALSTR